MIVTWDIATCPLQCRSTASRTRSTCCHISGTPLEQTPRKHAKAGRSLCCDLHKALECRNLNLQRKLIRGNEFVLWMEDLETIPFHFEGAVRNGEAFCRLSSPI